jgi:hypothetical protein
MGPGFFIFFQNNARDVGGKPVGEDLLNLEKVTRDDRDMLDILTMLCNCKR